MMSLGGHENRVFPFGLELDDADVVHAAVIRLIHELSPGWELHIRPWLNGLGPDLILLHPSYGIAVIDVDGERSSQRGGVAGHLKLCADEIRTMYCPRLGTRPKTHPITTVAIGKDGTWRGADVPLRDGGIRDLFEWLNSSKPLDIADAVHDIRQWLVEPDNLTQTLEPLILDKAQTVLAMTRTLRGLRRIKGPAGSGKSLVLAARAANLMADGKRVAVFSYNITLISYLSALAVRQYRRARLEGTWTYFHGWLKRICMQAELEGDYKRVFRGDFPSPEETADIGTQALTQLGRLGLSVAKFDAVLVDEGQDFTPAWWNLLRSVLNPGGEMLLVADATQDVYGVSNRWTDRVWEDFDFRGPWSRLSGSYRLPMGMLAKVQEFGELFLPVSRDMPEAVLNSQSELALSSLVARWVQVNDLDAIIETVRDEVMSMLKERDETETMSVFDVTLLTQRNATGADCLHLIRDQLGATCFDTYGGEDKDQKSQKMAFGSGVYEVRATTLHSFKGWESRAIVLVIEIAKSPQQMALIYAGLTRLKWHPFGSFITVVCSARNLRSYGKTWENFAEV